MFVTFSPAKAVKQHGGLAAGSRSLVFTQVNEEKGKAMNAYEHVFLARQDLSAQQVDELVETFKGLIEGMGGKVGRIESWGLKSLAYRIEKNRKAHYALMDFFATGDVVAELERQQRISESVLRYMTIRVEKHEDGPSAMLQKRDDRERDRESFDRPGGRGGDRGAPRGPRRF
jgi:small subunit ribosomal protein S6